MATDGKQQIREWFEPQMPNLHVASSNLKTSGDTVTWDATVSGDMFRQMGSTHSMLWPKLS